jgi:uncharacterized protein (DUF305 family)
MLQTKNILTYDKTHSDPCGNYISGRDFLKHMIPHHQVAIDMSKEVLKNSTDFSIIYLARNIIFKQSDEILFMENYLLSNIPNISKNNIKDKEIKIELSNQFTTWYPKKSRADNYQCGLHHFSTRVAKHHLNGKILTNKKYLDHMIYHHDVAIEMSDRLIKHTNNPGLLSFANEIVKAQRYEIWLMKSYLNDDSHMPQSSPIL